MELMEPGHLIHSRGVIVFDFATLQASRCSHNSSADFFTSRSHRGKDSSTGFGTKTSTSTNKKPEVFESECCQHLGTSLSELPGVVGLATSVDFKETKERSILQEEVRTALGPGGLGLVGVRGVPGIGDLRRRLLPLAKKLALMPDGSRRSILKDHEMNADVPMKKLERRVSAFAAKLRYTPPSRSDGGFIELPDFGKCWSSDSCQVFNPKTIFNSSENAACGIEEGDVRQLGNLLRELGACMVQAGLLVARLCDSALGGTRLEDAIWESGEAKARLIHYHPIAARDDRAVSPSEPSRRKYSKTKSVGSETHLQTLNLPTEPCSVNSLQRNTVHDLWQQWHYDYGIFTVLTNPMFLSSSEDASASAECENFPYDHTGLQILAGNVIDFVRVPPDCLMVQVGEAAQIVSGGRLAATLHCVCGPPTGRMDISRETFVTFLQPAWGRVLNTPIGATRSQILNPKLDHKSKGEQLTSNRKEDLISDEPHDESTGMSKSIQAGNNRPSSEEPVRPRLEDSGSIRRHAAVKAQDGRTISASGRKLSFQDYAKLINVVPNLESRWKEGCTFGQFSKETTAQYYGFHGRQSQKAA